MISISRPVLLVAGLLALPLAGAAVAQQNDFSRDRLGLEEHQAGHLRLHQTHDHKPHR